MPRIRTTPAKALAQIERRDARGAEQYRAELRYFHYRPRVVLGTTGADYYQGTRTLPALPGASAYPRLHAPA
ncbi:hypothetical protein [Streptomyces violaceus]|uniref:Uncharacterized protein n=1 Tax=Streptomyces violaceus TaxID=1936 RepID=A0ABY9UE40_STRVL|nr:hypothetical protein [Streptomyces janthinus]WND21151.1 hypothetical protein RI060_29130 [Streptomyces janthinus]GGS47842.1 hypothetical protein GCM10010270_17360 [Streptomyces janthinus]